MSTEIETETVRRTSEGYLAGAEIHQIPMDEIFADEDFNCRGQISGLDVVDLAASIKEKGLISPIVVQPRMLPAPLKYRIVAGHRRYEAHRILHQDKIEAKILEGLTDRDALILNFGENLKRSDLNIMQEARACQRLLDTGMGVREVARELEMSEPWVATRVKALTLPYDIQEACASGRFTQGHVQSLLKLGPADQYEAVRKIKEARERGEKVKITKEKTIANRQKRRERDEITAMIAMIIKSGIGYGLTTRALAWSCGVISDLEFQRDIEEECRKMGIKYIIPEEYMSELRKGG